MREADFRAGYPGRLVGTDALVRRVRNGVPEQVAERGVAFVPNPLPPKLDWERMIGRVSGALLGAERNLARLDAAASRLPSPHLLLRPLMLREAQESSKIENTIATLEEVVLQEAGVHFDRPDPEEVGNYIHALDHGLASRYPIGKQLTTEMHKLLMQGVRGADKTPGQYRRVQNMIGRDGDSPITARFVPPPPGPDVEELMRQLFEFLERDPDEIPVLMRAALAHYQFEAIHPFLDGNGRLGRLLVTLVLCRSKLLSQPSVYVSGYFEERRSEYYNRLLAVSQRGEWEEWLVFFLNAVAVQALDAQKRVDALFALRERYGAAFTQKRTSALMRGLIDHLFHGPAVTVQDVCRVLRVTDTAGRKYVRSLVEKGVLAGPVRNTHPQRFIAREILQTAEGRLGTGGTKRSV